MAIPLDYPGDRGQYGPSVSFREYKGYDPGCKPVYCTECHDAEVDGQGRMCGFCTILTEFGEAAAEEWFLDEQSRKLMQEQEALNVN